MDIELLMRVENEFSYADLQALRDESHGHPDPEAFLETEIEKRKTYRYVPLTLDISSIHPYHQKDEEHTTVFIKDQDYGFVVKIQYKHFQAIKETLTGGKTKTIEDFKFED